MRIASKWKEKESLPNQNLKTTLGSSFLNCVARLEGSKSFGRAFYARLSVCITNQYQKSLCNGWKFITKKVVMAVCRAIGTDPAMLLSSNKEKNVDGRGIVIAILTEHKYSDGTIAILTGMTRQAVNRIKNIYPDRIKRSYYLRSVLSGVKDELVEE